MRSIIIFAFSITMLALGTSCEKVIDVDLNEADPQYVFEGNLLEGSHDLEVDLSLTGSYTDPSTIESLDGALVWLQPEDGDRQVLESLGDGHYLLPGYEAQASASYQLWVEVEGEAFMAESYLWEKVPLQEVIYEYQEASPFQDEGYLASVVFLDPPERENYYRILVRLNGTLLNSGEDLILVDDKLFNGNRVEFPIFSRRFAQGDSIEVELRSLDAAAFLYFETLADITGGNGPPSAAPGNPESNWSGKALGYFSAHSSDQQGIRIE